MIDDLRSAIDELKKHEKQIAYTNTPVDSHAEISGLYRYIGAGGTVMRPTKEGPALICNNVKGFEDKSVLIGLLSSRKRVGYLLDCKPEELGFKLKDAALNPIMPIVIPQSDAKCQEEVYYANEEGFDIRKILPAPQNTEEDAGPYITMGMCYASDPDTKEGDVTIHRLCLQSKDEMTMFFTPGVRHLDAFRKKAEETGKNLPISISIGVDPAIEIASCFEPPTTPLGFNELSIAGGLRNTPVELVKCKSVQEYSIANAEFVVEGELVAGKRIQEDMNTKTGKAMPEFPGYTGGSAGELPVIKVKAVTHRKKPIIQTCIGPSEEHVSMAGIPTEASILMMTEKAMPGRVKNVYAHSAGGGKYMAVLQINKSMPSDEGRQRQAALIAFSAFSELKHVILVDDDVDIFDTNDVLWAMNTRFQGDQDVITIPGVRCHPLDPSQGPEYNSALTDRGMTCKTIFDCTVPYHLKDKFQRSKFKELNPDNYKIEYFKS
ncbi:MAG: UbiD family decarboxylase [Anaerostipes sp.]|nr:UbiD family decarboxylase [Anaerostipes sp.]